MSKSQKLFLGLVLCLSFLSNVALAEEAVVLDEGINLTELEVTEPNILPDSPVYFIKDWYRNIQSFLIFNPAKKAELEMKYASERLVEADRLIAKGNIIMAQNILEKHNRNIERVQQIIAAQEDGSIKEELLNILARKTIRHQNVLDGIEGKVELKDLNRIREIKEEAMQLYIGAENKEKIQERLEGILEQEKGSNFKELKNIQVLQRVKDLVPEQAKEKIEAVIERQTEHFQEKFDALTTEEKERIREYLPGINGEETSLIEVLSKMINGVLSPEIKEELKDAKEEIKTQLQERLEKADRENIQDFGERIMIKLENGGIEKLELIEEVRENLPKDVLSRLEMAKEMISTRFWEEINDASENDGEKLLDKAINSVQPKTIEALKKVQEKIDILLPQKQQEIKKFEQKIQEKEMEANLCNSQWKPVCGVDGKTYDNICRAEKIAQVKVSYEGICKNQNQTQLRSIEGV
ncbi:MAG: DUF5667 domain-containing protein [Patescibacteria group bacterium]